MADNRYMNSSAAEAAQVDLGLRSYMLGIYNYMTSALLVSGLFAFGTKMLATVEGPAGQVFLTPFGSLLFNSPFRFVLMFAPFVFVFWIGARLNSMSVSRAQTLFFVFAVMGMSLTSILIVFNMPSVARAFFVTAGAFAGLSLYGYTTKRNLSAFGVSHHRCDWSVPGDHRQHVPWVIDPAAGDFCDRCADLWRPDRL